MPLEGDNMMGVKRNNRSAVLRSLHRQGRHSLHTQCRSRKQPRR